MWREKVTLTEQPERLQHQQDEMAEPEMHSELTYEALWLQWSWDKIQQTWETTVHVSSQEGWNTDGIIKESR